MLNDKKIGFTKLDYQDILSAAKENFENRKYKQAEDILHQLVLMDNSHADVFFMLGTIYYSKGNINRAVNAFKRALKLKPAHTDAAVGLSIVYNDLGKYEEGQKIYNTAKTEAEKSRDGHDTYLNEKIAYKHIEVGDMYFQYERYSEAHAEYQKANQLAPHLPDTSLHIAKALDKIGAQDKAIEKLVDLKNRFPTFSKGRMMLGRIYYSMGNMLKANREWKGVLEFEPGNEEATNYLQIVERADSTTL